MSQLKNLTAFLKARIPNREVNSTIYALRRLRQNRSDLHSLVLEKKLSVNQAMIKAGLRKKHLRISHDVELTAQILKTNFSDEQIKILVKLIQSENC